MLQGIKNIIFDLGGIICDLEMERVKECFEELGMPRMAAMMDPCYPADVNERMESGRLSLAEACDEMRRIDNCPTVTNEQIAWVYREFLARVDKSKMETIERLRQKGVRTFVLSNTNPVAINIVRDRVREATGKELDDYFDHLYLSFEMGILKPAPAIFEKMMQEGEIDPSESLFIDDGQRNADAAHALGFSVYCPPTNGEWRQIFECPEN